MLRNDITSTDKPNLKWTDTRILRKIVEEYHRNNPHVSLEAAFEYIMLNSATFRALPTACIEKARKHLALPTVGIKPKQVTSEYNPSLFLVTQDKITPIGWTHIIYDDPADTLEAPDKPKPSTTVVHAERVVVSDEKMVKILDVTGLRKYTDLPEEYAVNAPSFMDSIIPNKDVFMHPTSQFADNYNIGHGDIMSIKDFGQMIKTMKEAGVRLSKINKTAKLEREHSGKFTVSI